MEKRGYIEDGWTPQPKQAAEVRRDKEAAENVHKARKDLADHVSKRASDKAEEKLTGR